MAVVTKANVLAFEGSPVPEVQSTVRTRPALGLWNFLFRSRTCAWSAQAEVKVINSSPGTTTKQLSSRLLQ